MNNNIRKAAVGSIVVFLFLTLYITYLQVYQGEKLMTHPKNKRLIKLEEAITRGSISDVKGRILAQTRLVGEKHYRVYPQGAPFAQLIGYNSPKFGRTGLESSYNTELLGLAGEEQLRIYIKNQLLGITAGDNLVMTIDSELQAFAYRLLGGQRGSIAAIDPATGEILALVSSPSYDPNRLEELWPTLLKDPASPMLNRATQGLYPPGSTMKVVTGIGALEKDPGTKNKTFYSPGYIMVKGYRLADTTKGNFSFEGALQHSSNAVFASLGLDLGPNEFVSTGKKFYFEKSIPFDTPVKISSLPKPDSEQELAEDAIGQGRILSSPLQMALVAAAVANRGILKEPHMIREIRDPGGELIKTVRSKDLETVTTPEAAEVMTKAMIAVVNGGTGRAAALPGIQVAGKTGSAENPHGPAHSWFIGFAPADNPKVAIAVIVENAGTGGTVAAPIARAFLAKALP